MATPELLRSILDAMAVGLIVMEPGGTIVYWNAWMVAASGRPVADVLGKTLKQLFPDAATALLDEALKSAIAPGASTLLTNALHPELLPLRTRAGRTLLHDITVSPLGPHDKGCVIQIADVTDPARRERFLRDRQNARYYALFESAPDVIINVDSDGIIRLANPAVARQFGYTPEDLVGNEANILFENDGTWQDVWRGADSTTASLRPVEVLVRLKSGVLRYFEVSAARWQDGTRTLTTAILRDVNERRDAEVALRESELLSRNTARELAEINASLAATSNKLNDMDRRKNEFLATLAHELRNPLAPLRNGLQLLKLGKDDPALIDRTRHMMDLQLGQMVRLIDDLLDVSRISNDRIVLNKELTSLDKVIRQAIETSGPLIHTQQHKITIDTTGYEIDVDADVVRLTQVFANLLNNAAKYTPRGGNISIKVEQQDSWVIVRIIDNGIGIPPEMLDKVFDIFMQVDHSLERAQGGLGIGLSLVKRLVELHGGTVEAHSEGSSTGSEFVVRLPIANQAVPVAAPRLAAEAPGPAACRRILVVDDNRDAASSLALILRLMGHETKTANDGLAAIEMAAEFQPHVALLDIGMPKLNGYETARRFRQKPWGQQMLLVALTGWGQEADRDRSAEAGFNKHLVKPVDIAEIERLLGSPATDPVSA